MAFTQLEKIETINVEDFPEKIPVLSEKNIGEVVLDFELSDCQLLRAIAFYYETKGEETLELINRLLSIYNVTLSFKIFKYLKGICLVEILPIEMRLYLAKEICGYKHDEECYSILGKLCEIMKAKMVCTTSRVDYILTLFSSTKQIDLATFLYSDIVDDNILENKYRFSIIKRLPSDDLRYQFYLRFLRNEANDGGYRVLAGQTLVMKKYEMEETQRLLVDIAKNISNEYNLRADATDVLLRYGDEDYKEMAKGIIEKLGSVGGCNPSTIYENAQNAHTSSIEQSAVEMLLKLKDEKIYKKSNGDDIDFQFVKSDIIKRFGESDIIYAVLDRIDFDVAQYSNLHITLKSALVLVYSFILNRQDDSLFERLFRELRESHTICSTGIMERMVNSLSGYEDFMIKISFEDQIKGNLHGRLNARIKNLDSIKCIHSKLCDCGEFICAASKTTKKNQQGCGKCVQCTGKTCIHECESECSWNSEFMEKAMAEMIVPTRKPGERVNFLRVYRLYIGEIMEEMKKEFEEYIDLTSFDLYFRKAMMNYDCA